MYRQDQNYTAREVNKWHFFFWDTVFTNFTQYCNNVHTSLICSKPSADINALTVIFTDAKNMVENVMKRKLVEKHHEIVLLQVRPTVCRIFILPQFTVITAIVTVFITVIKTTINVHIHCRYSNDMLLHQQ